jgi:hypothetical protein
MRPYLRPLLVLGALSATTLALAIPPPFDFTGTWTGTATAPGVDVVDMSAMFRSTGQRTFTGSVTFLLPDRAPEDWQICQVRGKYGMLVKLHLRCKHGPGQNGKATLRGHLDPTAEMLTGPVHIRQEGRGRHRGTFTLTKSPAESN